jgi:AraC-like DNA-binding protein
MQFIFFIAAFNALFFAVLMFQKRKALHDRILVFWLLYLGFYIGSYAFLSDSLFTGFHLLSAAFISLLLLQGPFLYLYISALIKENFKLSGKQLLHFVPFVLFNAFLLISSFIPEISQGIRLDHHEGDYNTPFLFHFFLIATVLSGPFYFILSISLFKRLDINIFNNFSFSEEINLDWLRKLVYSFGVIWTVLMVFATIHHVFHLFSWIFCTHGLFLSLSVFVILIGYFGLKQKEIFIQYPDQSTGYVTEPRIKYATMPLTEEEAREYVSRIEIFMSSEKPYLDAGLTLPHLANMLQIPSHLLSRIINEKLKNNFFDFINQYRVEEVKSKISEPAFAHLSILGIAFDCGFNTKSAFNRVFKKLTGITPSEYKKKT